MITAPRQITVPGKGRHYDIEGVGLLPSVTNILGVCGFGKEALIAWAASKGKESKAELKAAGDVGTEVHEAIRAILAGEEPAVLSDRAAPAFDSFSRWWEIANLTMISSEEVVWNEAAGYAGTMDMIAEDSEGNRVIVDFKTTKSVYLEAKIQVAAYAQCMNPYPAYGLIVRIPKDGKPVEAVKIPNLMQLYDRGFKPALELWKLWKEEA